MSDTAGDKNGSRTGVKKSEAGKATAGPDGTVPDKEANPPGTRAQDGQSDAMPRLPHERDETHQSQHSGPRPVVEQAASDKERGLEETDLYGSRGQRVPPPDNGGKQ
ncbi:hypothetical protein CURE108131_13060 [Cupriavidus respiraculi]|uniref:Uncharacterized protein n=1 Tax=Cupriavidus respiraculi TaxID=195930 RepID=A0ABN7Z6P5_9BURK|nr:hypothetical protein [Cupriavidus respiraculi]CAG9179977.1 hypothetical protein LMG21510_03952 [Cupriavidus respiraculi]